MLVLKFCGKQIKLHYTFLNKIVLNMKYDFFCYECKFFYNSQKKS